ncbi:MAG: glycosyltransferase family 4 protein [Gemmatimonadaceae bacterium]
MTGTEPCRVAVLASHPIQYFTPLYRQLAAQPALELEVFFCRNFGVTAQYDKQFGQAIRWDTDQLSGYRHRFLSSISPIKDPFNPLHAINPGAFFYLLRGFDALWVNGYMYPSNWLAAFGALLSRTKILFRSELRLYPNRAKTPLAAIRDAVVGAWVRHSDALLYIGEGNRQAYLAYGASPDKLHFTPYSVDVDRIARASCGGPGEREALRRKWEIPTDRIIVAYVGKLTPRKHPEALLELCAKPALTSGAHIVFAGSGPEEALLRREVERRGIKNVSFLGFVNQRALPEVYSLADLFVMPSEFEPWGLVLNEAMAAGLPVVVSDEVGAAEDLVNGHGTGYVFPSGRWDIMAEEVERLVADAELRKRFGEAARARTQLYSNDAAVEGILAALRALGLYAPPAERITADRARAQRELVG